VKSRIRQRGQRVWRFGLCVDGEFVAFIAPEDALPDLGV